MNPGRLTKAFARRIRISWRQQPNQSDIDALDANVALVGLVVRVRWAIVAALVAFSIVGAAVYTADGSFGGIWRRMIVPAAALGCVLLYNTYYQLNYRRFANIGVFNVVQLVLDIVVASLLIYYSGGVYSWFAGMYLLFVLEAALILPTAIQVSSIAVAAWLSYSAVLALVYFRVLPHTTMPFVNNDLQYARSYVIVRSLWELTVLGGAAGVGTMLMRAVRAREQRLAAESVLDARTGLFNRVYYRAELAREVERARRHHRGVSVVLADIDGFERFNTMFGVDAGNAMLVAVADAMRAVVGPASSGEAHLVTVARYGGEEFALVVPEIAPGESSEGVAFAEGMRVRVGAVRDEDRSVTVSIGVSAYPSDGRTAAELIGAADSALSAAKRAGGNRVVAGRVSSAEEDEG